LVIRFYDSYAPWRGVLANVGVTSKQYYEKAGREKFRKHPVGSGPFRFVESKTGEYILLEAVKDHHDYKVAFKTLKMILATDEMTRISMLQAGELDLIHGISPHNIKELKKNSKIRVKENSMTLGFKQLSTKLSWFPEYNLKLILAMAHAINRKELVDKLYLGHGYPLSLWASKIELGYDPKYEYEYDPEKAKRLLKESGYKPGSEILMTYTKIMPNVGATASAIQKYLSNIGMNVKIRELERGTYVTYFRNKDKRVGFMSLSGTAWAEDPHSRFMAQLRSDGYICPYWTRHNQKEMDDLIDQQAQEMDFPKRIKLIKKIRDINFKDPVSVPLFGTNIIYAMNKRIDYTWPDAAPHFIGLYYIKIME
ncbi:MAG: ABC transporter substrate-binding protein, partial [Deltaproteobacteria bacterium]|nr:ABC transporter substrate-binding protein [Deltaproteobacteria bacterium]